MGAKRANVVSVYRTVNLFAGIGLLRTTDSVRGQPPIPSCLICQVCGRIKDLQGCLIDDRALARLNQRVRHQRRFRVTNHELHLVSGVRSVTPEPLSRPLLGPRVRFTAAIGVGLLALILVAVGIPELHVHASHETGLYDEDCPLVTLSLGPAKAVLHDPPNAPHRSTTSEPSPLAHPAVLFALPLATLRARAPPLAS